MLDRRRAARERRRGPRAASFWPAVGMAVVVVLLASLLLGPRAAEIPYSDLKRRIADGQVAEVRVGDSEIQAVPKPQVRRREGVALWRSHPVPNDETLVPLLERSGVRYTGLGRSALLTLLGWILPVVVFFGLWVWLLRRMNPSQTVLTVGRSRARIVGEEGTGVTFADVAGVDEAKQELQEIVEFLRNPEKFARLGAKIPKGVLLVGPPGTGKTLLARAVAGEAGVTFFAISGAEFVEMFVGVGAARVRDLFAQAKARAPCIIFIDELDALGKARGLSGSIGGNDEREQTLNQLLVEMDGFDPRIGVIIMAATNRPEILDPALLRPGRFDRHVVVDRPDFRGRLEILRLHARGIALAPDVDLESVARRTPGFVGADLANLLNEAALLAARRDKPAVTMAEIDEALDRITAGLEKKNRLINEKERRIVAVHEAGHAIVAERVPTADPVHKISIIPRGVAALGYTQQLPTEDRYLLTRQELMDRIAVLLGGRVAEELVFGEISTGAGNDLERATDLARRMVTEFGMSRELGPVHYGPRTRPVGFPMWDGWPDGAPPVSEDTAQRIDREVQGILRGTYDRVRRVLEADRAALETVAERLLAKEVVEEAELREILGLPARTKAPSALEPAQSDPAAPTGPGG